MSTSPKPDGNRCARCGWPLVNLVQDGCVRGNCGYRPEPPLRREQYYDAERWDRETSPAHKANPMTPPAPRLSVRVIEECEWMNEEASEDGHSWGTECGHVFYLEDGDPESNSMKFCPFCGGSLRRVFHKDQEADQ